MVKILPQQLVKPFVARNKTDAADDQAVCVAMTRPEIRPVPAKSIEAQGRQMLMATRERLIRERTRLSNTIRGHGAEFGHTCGQGFAHLPRLMDAIANADDLPGEVKALFAEHWGEFQALQARIAAIEIKVRAAFKADEKARRLAEIPSVGEIIGLTLSVKAPAPEAFASGRAFTAWLGLTP